MRHVAAACLLFGGFVGASAGAAQSPAAPAPVYLAFAGPYSSSPSSAFGHLFLILPSSPNEPPPLWDVVSFSAETFGAGPFRYATVGIAGGFLGRYERLRFHEKARDYELLEDRDLWLLELDLSSAEAAALHRELAATAGRWYPYTFFEKNCAYYLQRLLARASGSVNPPSGPTSPTGVFQAVLDTELAGATFFRPGSSRRLREMRAGANEDVVSRLSEGPWSAVAADTAWLRQLPAVDRRFAHEYFNWKALHRTSMLDEDSRSGLALLRTLNARPSTDGDEASSPVRGAGQRIPRPTFHGYTRLSFSHVASGSAPTRVSVRYRGALHEATDPWLAHRPLNTLVFLALDVSSPSNQFDPRIDAFTVFSQRSLSPADWITPRRSWMLEVLARRGGLFDDRTVHLEARAGLGKTVQLSGKAHAYGLITAAVVGPCCDRAAFAPGLEMGLVWLATDRMRSGFRWSREHSVSEWSRTHERLRLWARYDLGTRWGITLISESTPLGRSLKSRLDWYP